MTESCRFNEPGPESGDLRNEVRKSCIPISAYRNRTTWRSGVRKRALKRSVSLYLRSKRRCVEALIQNNFTARDWYCTLTFTEDRLPPEKVKGGFPLCLLYQAA